MGVDKEDGDQECQTLSGWLIFLRNQGHHRHSCHRRGRPLSPHLLLGQQRGRGKGRENRWKLCNHQEYAGGFRYAGWRMNLKSEAGEQAAIPTFQKDLSWSVCASNDR